MENNSENNPLEDKKSTLKNMLLGFGRGFVGASSNEENSYSPDEAAFLVNPSNPEAAAQTKQRLVEMFKNHPIPKDFTHMLAAYGKLHESEQVKERSKDEDSYTVEQAAYIANPNGDPEKIKNTTAALSKLFPGGKIPKDTAHQIASSGRSELKVGEQETQFDKKQWLDINRRSNPIVAPRGSLLGTAGQMNARAMRALKTLDDPQITPQQISLAITDLAAIMQGGAPHEVALKQQQYGNIFNDLANLKTRLTGKPALAKQPEIVGKIKQIIGDIIDVDNQVITDNLDITQQTFSETINKNPDKWNQYKQAVSKTIVPKQNQAPEKQSFDDLYRKHGLLP